MDECENIVIDLEFDDNLTVLNDDLVDSEMGQSESKKSSKKNAGVVETKGTAMSFGFRKKLNTTPKKKKSKDIQEFNTIDVVDSQQNRATVITNPGLVMSTSDAGKTDFEVNDKNGNSGPAKPNTTGGAVARSNRFGFRTAYSVRPASTGITPKIAEYSDVNENYNNNSIAAAKRRSKSAHSGRTSTSNRYNNDQQSELKINNRNINYSANEYQRQKNQINQNQLHHHQVGPPQYHPTTIVNKQTQAMPPSNNNAQPGVSVVNSDNHTNLIVKPTPRPPTASFSRFTLQTTNLPKPQYPVPISLNTNFPPMDAKSAKQMANNSRKSFLGPRDISTDSGISVNLDSTPSNGSGRRSGSEGRSGSESPKLHKLRPRNLQMVMNGRHKFEVRDLDDSNSSDSTMEVLTLPKLPSAFDSNHQPIPLCGLVRSNTVIEREALTPSQNEPKQDLVISRPKLERTISDVENCEEKLFLDRSATEKHSKISSLKEFDSTSKNSSPGSSRSSWCNAGESMAAKDCSSLSSSDESKDNNKTLELSNLPEDDNSLAVTISDKPFSCMSSFTLSEKPERPNTLANISESKFAEMAAAAGEFLLDDETSPTISLVSNSDSDEPLAKNQKKKINEEIQEKDLDEISPELETSSPLSPGTPTHASNSLSLSDVGRDFLIDDEIADQPALTSYIFNEPPEPIGESSIFNGSLADTPTLKESLAGSLRSLKSTSKARTALQAAIELNLRTPMSLRKAVLNRAESLDTLSPCESIASDDLMMDFEYSSMDSIDRMSASIRSQSGSALNALDDTLIFPDIDSKSTEMIKEWKNVLRVHKTEKDSIISHLPARATRLLNRSRLQQQCQLSNAGSDSPKSNDSLPTRRTPSRNSSIHHHSNSSYSNRGDPNSSSDDLVLYDKSFRNAMLQDILYFKKQVLKLRKILQETDTLNPFEDNNGGLLASCGLNLDDINLLTSTTSLDDAEPQLELSDLRRQGQVNDRDRTIRLQKNIIDKLEGDLEKVQTRSVSTSISEKEVVNTATQTDRIRPPIIGQEGLSRTKPEFTSYVTHFPAITTDTTIIESPTSTTRRHTIISTTFTNFQNYNNLKNSPRRASIGWDTPSNGYKPVKITLIGEPIQNGVEAETKCFNGKEHSLSQSPSVTIV